MGNIVGIDLGTTNSVAAFKFSDVEVVTSDDNTPPDRKLMRSVVAYEEDRLLVGEKAYYQLRADPKNVVISIKRLMGRGFNDSVIQDQLTRFGYKITKSSHGTDNSLSVWLGDKEYQPEDISAEILKKLLQNSQLFQNRIGQKSTITQAVVTVPAYFNDKQRYATQTAVTRSGLALLELLAEPTAAAISYGFKPGAEDVQTILVYDFGGGTFDSSLITASGNQFIESGKAGDLWLGGDDIDYRIMEFVKQQVAQQEGLDDIDALIAKMPYYHRVRFQGDLKIAVEQAKIHLSSAELTRIIPSTPLLDEFGATIYIDVELSRTHFEKMILPLVERTIQICQDTLKCSEYPAESVDIILLVGGSSQIPLVQRKVRQAFGADKVVVHPRPMYAVAEGAAIVAAGLADKVTTVSRDYFIQLVDEPRYKLINEGDILPVTKSHTFKTEADGQRLIHFKFFSPDRVRDRLDKVNQDEPIGDMWLALDKFYPRGTEVLVTVELDEKNSSLDITAALKNDPSIRVSSSFSRGLVDEDISAKVENIVRKLNQAGKLTAKGVQYANELAGEVIVATNQIRGRDGKVQVDRVEVAQKRLKELEAFASKDHNTAELFIREINFVVEECGFLIPEAQSTRLRNLSSELRDALATNNLSKVQQLSEEAKREIGNLPDVVHLILASKDAIARSNLTNPTQAHAMTDKLLRLINAMKRNDINEADRLWRDLQPDVRQYMAQELPISSIATGMTR